MGTGRGNSETPSHIDKGTLTKSRPNILFMLTDDQRFDDLGCMGNEIIQTPNLDRLAAGGVIFNNAFVHGHLLFKPGLYPNGPAYATSSNIRLRHAAVVGSHG